MSRSFDIIPLVEHTAGTAPKPGTLVLVAIRDLASQVVDELRPAATACEEGTR